MFQSHFRALGVAMLLSVATLTSCTDDDDDTVSFDVSISGFVLQENDDNGVQSYIPFLGVTSSSNIYPLKSVAVYNSESSIDMVKVNDYFYASSMTSTFYDLDSLSGTYTVQALISSSSGTFKSISFSLSESDTLSAVVPTQLEYTNSYIRMTMPAVTNASVYGIILTPYEEGEEPQEYSDYFYSLASSYSVSDGEVSGSQYFSLSYLGAAYARVYAYAASENGMLRKSENYITLVKE